MTDEESEKLFFRQSTQTLAYYYYTVTHYHIIIKLYTFDYVMLSVTQERDAIFQRFGPLSFTNDTHPIKYR